MDRLVASNQRQTVGHGLGDEDAVEWIAMVTGKRLQCRYVIRPNG